MGAWWLAGRTSPLKMYATDKANYRGTAAAKNSVRPLQSSTQTASRSVQPFLQGSLLWQTDRPTDRPRYLVCNSWLHLRKYITISRGRLPFVRKVGGRRSRNFEISRDCLKFGRQFHHCFSVVLIHCVLDLYTMWGPHMVYRSITQWGLD